MAFNKKTNLNKAKKQKSFTYNQDTIYDVDVDTKQPVVGLTKKKSLGQHFLRQHEVVEEMIDKVTAAGKTVFEIGCGDGFLTSAILDRSACQKLISVELDGAWAKHVREKLKNERLHILECDILNYNWNILQQEEGVVLLANLPYNITFPILHLIVKNRAFFTEGVFMVQEEVAQKIAATTSGVSAITIFMQAYLEFELLSKVRPEAFIPPPKVFSRTVYFRPRIDTPNIEEDEKFWEFVRICFHHPRQTLRNNFKSANLCTERMFGLDDALLGKRAQHLKLADFLKIWHENRDLYSGPGKGFRKLKKA